MEKKIGWDGHLAIKLERQEKDLFFYKMAADYKGKRVEFVLPRYHPMIGWIEIFGLPPQNEWMFLGGEENWENEAEIVFNDGENERKMTEKIAVRTNLKSGWRLIKAERKLGEVFENQTWIEDWSAMPSGPIKKYGVFEHSSGTYFVTIEARHDPVASLLDSRQMKFIEEVRAKKGEPTMGIWLKNVVFGGDPLPLYYEFFPFWQDKFSATSSGSILEIGYEKENSHGDWYKIVQMGERIFEIEEGGWVSKEVVYKGEKVKLKDTYEKWIREIV